MNVVSDHISRINLPFFSSQIKAVSFSALALGTIQLAGCTPQDTEEPRQPNILFAISDDQSFGHTSFEGSEFINTPAFDRMAREGIYFSNAIAPAPGCAPSRSALVTGRYIWQNEQSGQHGSSWLKKHVPFIDLLDQNGYVSGRTGKGVDPYQYARDESDSLWRSTNAGGIVHSNILYDPDSPDDERPAGGITRINYFENFKYFMENVREDEPFFFWYGAYEPHRGYEEGSWKRSGKNLEDVQVPEFLPDNGVIRGDLLDYAIEVEWFDLHLQRMLAYLEEIGELENTIVIVTSDQGMPFPRAKPNCYEYGIHVPFAIRYPERFPGNRIVDDPLNLIDLAPTLLELTNTSHEGMLPISGKSIVHILESNKEGIVDESREYVFSGRERHSSSRYENWGYPQRAIRNTDFLLIWNQEPRRWPLGAPQRIKPGTDDELLPMYGIDEKGIHHPQWAFTDMDPGPSRVYIVQNHDDESIRPYFDMSVAKRPEYELYNVITDPDNINNLSGNPAYSEIEEKMKEVLMQELIRTEDPRVVGPDKDIFDSYPRYMHMREFPKPDWVD